MSNELKFNSKVVFLGGTPFTLPVASSDPGSPTNGDMYYNSTSDKVRVYQGGAWTDLATGSGGVGAGVAGRLALYPTSSSSVDDQYTQNSQLIDVSIAAQASRSSPITYTIPNPGDAVAAASFVLTEGTQTINGAKTLSGTINLSALTASKPLKLDGSNNIISSDIALASQVSGVLPIANGGTNSSSALSNNRVIQSSGSAIVEAAAITAARALISDANGIPTHSAVTSTELGHVSGVTSAIQTQLNAKAADNIVIKKDGSVTYTASQPMGGFKLTGLAAGSGAGDSVRYEQAILTSGANAFAADQSIGGFKLTNLADPSANQDAVTLAYLSARLAGLKPKAAVRVATTTAGTLATSFENGDAIDGITLATGDRILIKNQAAPADNGIYTVNASGAPTRATDFDSLSPVDEINGAWVSVQLGTANAGKVYIQYGVVATLGTDAINFEFYDLLASLVGGDMITLTSSTISVDLATVSGLESSNPGNVAGQLRIKLEASSPSLQIDGSNQLGAKLNAAGAITSGASGLIVGVDNSTIEISTNALRVKALGISNSHISASAAIALTKLAAVTANRALASDASGFIVASSVTDTELGHVSGVTSAIQTQLNAKASTALSNLAAVAINTSLISDTDNTDDLGSDAIEWKDLWAYSIKHNSAGTPNLGISTTGNNGSISLSAHGTGNVDIAATKLRRSQSAASSDYMEDQYFDALTLAAATSSATEISSSLSFAVASFDGAVINYRIKEATSLKARIGQLIVSSDGTISSSSDQFSETAALGSALGLSLSTDISGGNVRILYNNTHATNAATLRCQIRRFRA